MRILILIITLAIPGMVNAQEEVKPRKSPMAVATHKSGDTYIKIVYSQPSKRDRMVFGGIVPYAKIWRTGANEATEITLTSDISLGGEPVSAGTYSLFTIPNKDSWTIILNRDLGMWGNYSYKSENDLVRIEVPVEESDQTWESFNISFKSVDENNLHLLLRWDEVVVKVPIEL